MTASIRVIHGTWVPGINFGFMNSGKFLIWIETEVAVRKKATDMHLNQLNNEDALLFLREEVGLKDNFVNALDIEHTGDSTTEKGNNFYLIMPSVDGKPLPSPLIAKNLDIDIPDKFDWKWFRLSCLQPQHVLTFLKNIHFASYYFSDDIKLGADLAFWIEFSRVLDHVIRKDQYIPALKCYIEKKCNKKQKELIHYYPYWKIISTIYEESVRDYAGMMPLCCTLTVFELEKKFFHHEPENLLKHFSENIINDIISGIPFTKKIKKSVEGTFIDHCIDGAILGGSIDLKQAWKEWFVWQKNLLLSDDKAKFTLCFRLNPADSKKPDEWHVELLLESKKDPSFKVALADFWRADAEKKKRYTKYFGKEISSELLLQLGHASRIYKKLDSGLNTEKPEGFYLNMQEAFEFLKEDSWVLQDSGFKVVIPSFYSPEGRERLKVRVKAKTKQSTDKQKSGGFFNLDSIINFRHQLSIDGDPISSEEWKMLVEAKQPLVYFRGDWLELDASRMAEMMEFWNNGHPIEKEMSLMDVIKSSVLNDDYEFAFDKALSEMMSKLHDQSKFSTLQSLETFQGTLRPYQKRGYSWLYYLEQLNLNPCLADDMGLGKTIQIIALLLHEREAKKDLPPTLLIAPTSVLVNWKKEIERFAPTIRVIIHHGHLRLKTAKDFAKKTNKNDVVITSFALARRDAKLFRDIHWQRIVVDEAQNIKNPKAAQTKAILKLKSKNRIALTGTPVENRLLDLWSIFNFLNPGYLGTAAKFKKQFEIPIQRNNSLILSKQLKKLVTPFILRRLKTDKNIIQDLPDKLEQRLYCNLTKEQATLYGALVKEVSRAIEETEGIQRKGLMLSTLLKLKQICNHPAHFLQDNSVFSIERSHKLTRLTEMLEEIMENGESVLIFTQFKEIGLKLEHLLKTELHYNTYFLHGGTSLKKREAMVEAFQDEETEPSVFILSLKAGGVGLTLTKANHVFHFDRWWNPAVENQATDRAYRIGQNKKVFVHKFVAVGTLEERIDDMIEKKKSLSDSVIGSGESWLTNLDNNTFKKLIQLNHTAVLE